MLRILALLLLLLWLAPAEAASPLNRNALDADMQRIVNRLRLDGASLWVSHQGRVVHVGHYGGYGPQTRIPIASASKWPSALVFARLVERGSLRWDSTVGEWWPTAPADKRAITLAQLFSHTSGLPGEETGCVSNALTTLQACAGQILAGPLHHAPGTAFAYGSLSMHVAGAMAERATGESWDRLFQREVAQPLGLTATDFGFMSSAPGLVTVPNPRVDGGVRTTLADYVQLMKMWESDGLIPDGPQAGRRYLQPATLRAMQRDHALGTVRVDQPDAVQLYAGWGYGFGFWLMGSGRAGNPMIDTSPGFFGFAGWMDGAAGVAGVFMVQDQNTRVAADVRSLQQHIARELDFQRRTQSSAAGDRPPPPSMPRDPASRNPCGTAQATCPAAWPEAQAHWKL
jgi:CubicO group peptidase (beta-lactamase class C family)